ncbi:cytosine-5--methyltransferase [Rhizopus microsporus ATCC 52813]|uniref:tRNA (cytosine(38)-C(5))-methyltransferase n=2 Tax=Rhizopus microsporus TaxID=58291 RepID=A0A2G4T5L3_RHIZD|nr:cytosine-5--methyltransferase [Rhizopus microsporus ATCC 52813]PHZ16305.1 cytosine-5--methyltransferase [Rhizopus microsporus ATCC 52813]
MAPLRQLEFYSGIGGMHYAANLAGWDVDILKAFDINTVANEIYRHNFNPKIVGQKLIETLSTKQYEDFAADVWTMSPPCQPYTRQGLQQGSEDARAKSFLYLMNVLKKMRNKPKYILVENVKGFEESDSRDILVDALQHSDYNFQEFLLTPLQLGIPNSRMRYYLLAKYKPYEFAVPVTGTIINYIPLSAKMSKAFIDNRGQEYVDEAEVEAISAYLEPNVDEQAFLVPDKVLLKNMQVFDIVKPTSRRSCCFTKGYFHYAQGTGSILQMSESLDTSIVFQQAMEYKDIDEGKQLELLKSLRLRYFTPREVANLMGFPDQFSFPNTSSLKQKYRTLGNSINVKLVSELMRYLLKEPFVSSNQNESQ